MVLGETLTPTPFPTHQEAEYLVVGHGKIEAIDRPNHVFDPSETHRIFFGISDTVRLHQVTDHDSVADRPIAHLGMFR